MHAKTRIAAIAVAVLGATAQADITFFDGEFVTSDYTFQSVNGGQNFSRVLAGGNPGAYLRVVTPTNAAVEQYYLNTTFVADLSSGAIDSFDISLDYGVEFGFGQGMGFGFIAEQDGTSVFFGGTITGPTNPPYRTHALTGVVAGDLPALDFSQGAAPITFGFYTGNSGGNGITVGYDNFSVEIAQVPTPASAGLLGVVGLTSVRRRRGS